MLTDIDIAVPTVSLSPDTHIARGLLVSINLTTNISHPGPPNIRAVIPLVADKYNFRAYYLLSERPLANSTDVLLNSVYNTSNMADGERQKGFPVSGSTELGQDISMYINI